METKRNFPFTHEGKMYWYSRACASVAIVYTMKDGELHALVNKRGQGAPNHKGKLNCVCGYLEHNDTLETCASKECWEETGFKVDPSELIYLFTNSAEFNGNQNVSSTFMVYIPYERFTSEMFSTENCEPNEVDGIFWVSLKSIEESETANEDYAFNHNNRILQFKDMAKAYADLTSQPVFQHEGINEYLSILNGHIYVVSNSDVETYEINMDNHTCTANGKTRPFVSSTSDMDNTIKLCYLLSNPKIEFYLR
ncbi:MAG: NUDIX domain-containing protein [Bacteroidales bacterium]